MRHGLVTLGAVALIAAAGATTAGAKGGPGSPQCKAAQAKLARDQQRGAPPGVIRADQKRVQKFCG